MSFDQASDRLLLRRVRRSVDGIEQENLAHAAVRQAHDQTLPFVQGHARGRAAGALAQPAAEVRLAAAACLAEDVVVAIIVLAAGRYVDRGAAVGEDDVVEDEEEADEVVLLLVFPPPIKIAREEDFP